VPEDSAYRVVVVGAGFGGLGMAVALEQAGIEDFLIIDKGDGLGGTWRDNTYPGAACDVPSRLYSFSSRLGRWSRRFPPQQEILGYLKSLSAEHGLGPRLRLRTGVASAEFDERGAVWQLTLDDGERLRAPCALAYAPRADWTAPSVSPLLAGHDGLPPLLI
jgi:cation diffusion facilitator CzcD-associated flavoprotein CzcO